MDIYEIFASIPGIRDTIISYLDKYADNLFIFRILSKSFRSMQIYDRFTVCQVFNGKKYVNQPKHIMENFLKIHKIKSLYLSTFNKKIIRVDPKYFKSLKKLVIDDIPKERDFYFIIRFFSQFSIENLKLRYLQIKYPENLLRFRHLKTIDITITSKDNEELIFDFLIANKDTLKKLKIGIYTGRGIDEKKLVSIIENHLKLEYIDIRGDLLTPNMIHDKMRKIIDSFAFQPLFLSKFKYITNLRMHSVKNTHLNTLFNHLESVESVSLWGNTHNFEIYTEEDNNTYPDFFQNELNDLHPYDGSVAKIDVKSPFLNHLFLNGFTIKDFRLQNPERFQYFYIEDVHFLHNLYLPKLINFTVDNHIMNPRNLNMKIFKFPQLKEINLHKIIFTDPFIFHKIESINIQNSIIGFDFFQFVQKHKNTKSILLFNNEFTIELDFNKIESYTKKKKITFENPIPPY